MRDGPGPASDRLVRGADVGGATRDAGLARAASGVTQIAAAIQAEVLGKAGPIVTTPRSAIRNRVDRTRVLIVDDHADTAELLAMALGMRGFDAMFATSEMDAIECCASFRPHLAIVDLLLPGSSGRAVIVRLRALPGMSRLATIAYSGWDTATEAVLAQGFDAHLHKPTTIETLIAAITDLRSRLPGPASN